MNVCVIFLVFLVQKILGIYTPSITYHQNYSKVTRLTPVQYFPSPVKTGVHSNTDEGVKKIKIIPKNEPQPVRIVRKLKRQPINIEIYTDCPPHATGQFVYALSCNQFLNCWHGRGVPQTCAPGTLFNPKTLECDYPQKVECLTGPRQNEYGFTSTKEKLQQVDCPDGFSGLIPNYNDCSKFINCNGGVRTDMDCPPGTLFDVTKNVCDFADKAKCFNKRQSRGSIDSKLDFGTGAQNRPYGQYNIGQGPGAHSCDPGSQNCQFGSQNIANQHHLGQNSFGYHCDPTRQNCRQDHVQSQGAADFGVFPGCDPTRQNCNRQSSGSSTCDPARGNCNPNNFAPHVTFVPNQPGSQNCDPTRQNCYGQTSSSSPYCDPTKQNCQNQFGQRPTTIGQHQGGTHGCDPSRQNCHQNQFGQQPTSFGQNYGGVAGCDPTKQNCYGQASAGSACDPTRENCQKIQFGQQPTSFGQTTSPNCDPTRQNCNQNQFGHPPTTFGQSYAGSACDPTRQICPGNQYGSQHSHSYGCDPTRQNCQGTTTSFTQTSSTYGCDPNRQNCNQNQFEQQPASFGQSSHSNNCDPTRQNCGNQPTQTHQIGVSPNCDPNTQNCKQSSCNPSVQDCNFGTHQGRSFTSTSHNSVQCSPGASGLEKHPYDCSKFLNCANGQTFVQDCGPGTLFNPLLKVCDFPHNVKCEQGGGVSTNRVESGRNNWESGTSEWNRQTTPGSSYGSQNWNNGSPTERSDTNTLGNGASSLNPGTSASNSHNWGTGTVVQSVNCPGGNCQHDNRGYARSSSTVIPPTVPSAGSGYSEMASNGTHLRWKDCSSGVCRYYVQKITGYPGNIHAPVTTTAHINRYSYVTPNYNTIETLTTPRTVYIKPKPTYQNDYDDILTPHASNYPRYYPQTASTTPRTWPPPFPQTDVNADYVFDYEEIPQSQPKDRARGESTCGKGDFKCAPDKCIPTFAVCDRITDCNNGNDEKGCNKYLDDFVRVNNSKLAVMEDQRWDNVSIETCAALCLTAANFTCKSFNYRKIDRSCFLVGANIADTGALISYYPFDYCELKKTRLSCKGKFKCPNNKCIDSSQKCDGFNDCGDRFDEKHCRPSDFGYSIKLVGSKNKNEGSIQIKAFNFTGYICDDHFNMKDADVACKELGYPLGAAEVKANSYYAKNITKPMYMMDDIICVGNESSLLDCDFSGWGVHNCLGLEVAGVVCKTAKKKCSKDFWQCQSGNECLPLAFLCDGLLDCSDESDESPSLCDAPTEIRLVGGKHTNEGRIEIRHHGAWGTICDDDFNEDAAKVICKSLGYKGSVQIKKDSHFGEGDGPIWLDQVFCLGNETKIEECIHWNWGEHNCDHSEDVGVICSNEPDIERHSQAVKPLKAQYEAPITCGYRKDNQFRIQDNVQYRVVRGSKADKGDYPWQAAIKVKGQGGRKAAHWCGAIIITEKFLLTAAHCLIGYAKGAYVVVAGDYNVDEAEGTEQEVFIEDFYIHEDFRKGHKMNNDIAVIKLKGRGFKLTDDVQPICLPDFSTDYSADLNCTISGFGSIESGKSAYSHDLRAGWIPIQSDNICKMPHVYGDVITEGMVCAGSLDEGVDACDGDSGGPLACLHEGLFTLYGITSWGQHCGYANKPGVYVKVAYYRKWIDDILRKHF